MAKIFLKKYNNINSINIPIFLNNLTLWRSTYSLNQWFSAGMTCCPSVGMTRNLEEMEKNNSLKDRHQPPLNPSGRELLTAGTSKQSGDVKKTKISVIR